MMKATGDHRIHAEFGHFSSLEIFSLFEKYAVRNADSLGLNEVELQLMLDYWNGKVTDINAHNDS
jgi:ADP-dependent phosphofructokinase/glucokinase